MTANKTIEMVGYVLNRISIEPLAIAMLERLSHFEQSASSDAFVTDSLNANNSMRYNKI